MSQLISFTGTTINSKVIAEITGKQHSNVMQDIRNLIDQLGEEKGELTFQLSSYFGENQKQNPMYELSKKEALLLASGYNAILRLKIIDRLEELEKSKPRTHLEVIQSEMALLIENQKKDEIILKLTPRSLYFDRIVRTDGLITMEECAKLLNIPGVGRNKLYEKLREGNVIMKNSTTPYQHFVSKGYFELKEEMIEISKNGLMIRKVNVTTMVAQKGLAFIFKFFGLTEKVA